MPTPGSRLVISLSDASTQSKTVSFRLPSKSLVDASWSCLYSQTSASPHYSFQAQVRWSGCQSTSSPPKFALLGGGSYIVHAPLIASPFPSSGAVDLQWDWNQSASGYAGLISLDVLFKVEPYRDDEGAETPAERRAMALTGIIDTQRPHDVRVDFAAGRELWANSKILASASPYFKGLLESGFAESSLITSKETSTEVTTSTNAGQESESSWDGIEDDSDDETDTLVAKGSYKPAQKGSYHNIKSPASFTTYRAVLVYLLSHHIAFAPLLSTFRASTYPAATEAASSRHQAIRVLFSKTSELPAPASPKSIYRLAHLLQLPKLESLALIEIQRQLTVENAAYELYGSVASVYDAIREVVLDFCVENWAAVCETSAMKEMEQLAEAGELSPKVTATAMQLAKRLKK